MAQLNSLVLFTADPWESAMPFIRVIGPAKASSVTVLRGNNGVQTYPERIAQADLVVIQRDFPHLPGYNQVMALALAANKKVIYEIDDLLFEMPEDHVSYQNYLGSLLSMMQAAMQADGVVTSTPMLRDYFTEYNPNTCYTPNLLDDTLWPLQPNKELAHKEGPVVIGYMGGQTHLTDLEMIAPALVPIVENYGDRVQIRFWGGPSPASLAGYPQVEHIPINVLNYPEFSTYFCQQSCDIFIAPLQDTYFNRCKSPIKYLEYGSMGIPGVFSCIRPYMDIIQPGINGFMASTIDEWYLHLSHLIQDADLRGMVGSQAFKTVQDQWLLTRKSSLWFDTYNRILNGPHDNKEASSKRMNAIIRANQYQSQLENKIDTLNVRVNELESLLQQRDTELGQYKKDMQAILNSQSWRIMMKIGQIRSFLGIKKIVP